MTWLKTNAGGHTFGTVKYYRNGDRKVERLDGGGNMRASESDICYKRRVMVVEKINSVKLELKKVK